MSNNELIISLIQQDLKHNQLISGLHKLHLETDGMYYLNLVDTVADLMGIEGSKSDQWFDIYDGYLQKAHTYNVEDGGSNLRPVAEECFFQLEACLKIERHIKESAGQQEQGTGQK